MSIGKMVRKIRTILVVVMALLPGVPVSASGGNLSSSLPPIIDDLPAFVVSRIDLTNNQFEFSINLNGILDEKLKNFGLFYLTGQASTNNVDVLALDSVNNDWLEQAFWSDDKDLAQYIYADGAQNGWRKYVVDTKSDILANTSRKILYVAEFESGKRWVSSADYSDCYRGWYYGMSCNAVGVPTADATKVLYMSMPAPEGKLLAKEKDVVVPESSPEVNVEPEVAPESSSEVGVEPETVAEAATESGVESSLEPEAALDSAPDVEPAVELKSVPDVEPAVESKSAPDVEPATESVLTSKKVSKDEENLTVEPLVEDKAEADVVKLATVEAKSVAKNKIGAEAEVAPVADTGETTETPEGPGETTLDVPILGGNNESLKFNWIPYFVGGAVLGWILTWFLVYFVMKKKVSYI